MFGHKPSIILSSGLELELLYVKIELLLYYNYSTQFWQQLPTDLFTGSKREPTLVLSITGSSKDILQ